MSDDYSNQKRTNVTNRLIGDYQAKVVDVVHPKGLYMVSIRLLKLWDDIPDKDLPFAEFRLPLGAKPSAGHVVPVEAGDLVWVSFPRGGDTRYPLITGSLYHAPNYESNLPDDVNEPVFAPKRSAGEPTPPAYDRKDDLYQRLGLREHKTHQGGWSITHVATGTAIEITPDGKCVIHTEGDQFQSATGKHLGQYNEIEIKVSGDASVNCGGNGTLKSGGDTTVKAGGDLNLEAGGSLNLKANNVTGKASSYDFK
ncbi:MAG: hypothetical protein CMJ20_01740 [Phycisphaeraceae bacterium]|nr:hypothetical protein [Phycisphaeraceae bacterium]|tara:strand:+ start:17063 stop:17824 length:762 start_codon:yes stop_codon:yes gene_type:complete